MLHAQCQADIADSVWGNMEIQTLKDKLHKISALQCMQGPERIHMYSGVSLVGVAEIDAT